MRLTDDPASDQAAAWSHDGQRIAFASKRTGDYEIYVMRVDGLQVTRLTDNVAEDTLPTRSPDDTSIAFVSERDGNYEIYRMPCGW